MAGMLLGKQVCEAISCECKQLEQHLIFHNFRQIGANLFFYFRDACSASNAGDAGERE